MYSIHPSHLGKSARFLKNPENIINGKTITGTTAETDFGSKITLPIKSPREAPQNDINPKMKQCKKNCGAEFAKSTIK